MNRRCSLVLVAAALLGLAWLVTPASPPPLYDGVGMPDEPYRYVTPPRDVPSDPPTTAFTEVPASAARFGPVIAKSAEQGPQVEVQFGKGTLVAPPGATKIRVTAEPKDSATQPADGPIWGNTYKLTATSDTGTVAMRPQPDAAITISLRTPSDPKPEPLLVFNDGSGWRRLDMFRSGNDVFSGSIHGAGDYALVRPPDRALASGTDNGTVTIVVLAISVVVLAGGIVLVRVRSSRERTAAPAIPVDDLRYFVEISSSVAQGLPSVQRARVIKQANELSHSTEAEDPDHERLRLLVDNLIEELRTAETRPSVQLAISMGQQARRSLGEPKPA